MKNEKKKSNLVEKRPQKNYYPERERARKKYNP